MIVTREMLEALVAELAPPSPSKVSTPPKTSGTFNLESFIAKHLPDAKGPELWPGGTRWILDPCPFNPEHTGTAAAVLQTSEGKFAFKCQHDGCAGRQWRDLRTLFEGARTPRAGEPNGSAVHEKPNDDDRAAADPASPLGQSFETDTAEEELLTVTAEELLARDLPPLEYVIDPIARVKDLAMIYAPRGAGKTWFSLSLSLAIAAAGADLFGRWRSPLPRTVLHVDGEMAAQSLRQRVAQLIQGSGWNPGGRLRFLAADLHENGVPNLATPEGQAALDPLLEGVDVLVIDNLSSLMRGLDENEAASWDPVQAWLLNLRRRGKTVFMIHHAGKTGSQRGTSKREDVLNLSIQLRLPEAYEPGDGAAFVIRFDKARDFAGPCAEELEVELKVSAAGARWEARAANLDNEILEMQRAGITMREISKNLGKSSSTVCRRLTRLKRLGRVAKVA